MSSARAPITAPKTAPLPVETQPPSPQRRSRRTRWIVPIVVVVVVAGGVYRQRQVSASGGASSLSTAGIRTATVRSGTLEKTLRLSGVTASKNQITLIAPRLRGRRGSSNYMLNLQELVPPGSQVSKGDMLARFDNQYMVNRIDSYEDRVIRQEARIRKSKATLKVKRMAHEQKIRVAKARLDKAALDLKTIPIRSEIQTERFRLAHEEAGASYQQLLSQTPYVEISESSELRRLELDLKEAEVEFRRAKVNLDKMLVQAPVNGLTVMLSLKRGAELDQIKKGDLLRSGMPYMLIVDLNSMMVNAELSQADSEMVHIGARVTVRFDAFPDLKTPARVHSIGTIARATKRRGSAYVRNVPVRLSLEKTDPRVIPNYSVSADLVLAREESAAIVPLECVFSDQAGGKPYAFVQGANGWERRELELGLANNIAVAVRSGLEEGAAVLTERPAPAAQSAN